ncbi:MAG: A/G-specific adenine glycosylase [Fastidiosipilaceae bacterium]|jgi:A/G-specific adenine glycosylase
MEKSSTVEFRAFDPTMLLNWFDDEKRAFPWRRTGDPYAIWVSEIMLQQTRAATVVPYFLSFMRHFPTVEALARSTEMAVLKSWEGLGYYSRAKNLREGARYVLENHNGDLPRTYSEIIKVPGIGDYTAGAILSLAFNLPIPAVDGNVVRVFVRLTDSTWTQGNIKDRRLCRRYVASELEAWPSSAAGINEALIELGATICAPRRPRCDICPLSPHCEARQSGRAHLLPLRRPPKKKPIESLTILILQNQASKKVLVTQRPADGLLADLWEFPSLSGHMSDAEIRRTLVAHGQNPLRIQHLPARRHIFTHLIWDLQAWHCVVEPTGNRSGAPVALKIKPDGFSHLSLVEDGGSDAEWANMISGDWVDAADLEQLPFSAALIPYRDISLF